MNHDWVSPLIPDHIETVTWPKIRYSSIFRSVDKRSYPHILLCKNFRKISMFCCPEVYKIKGLGVQNFIFYCADVDWCIRKNNEVFKFNLKISQLHSNEMCNINLIWLTNLETTINDDITFISLSSKLKADHTSICIISWTQHICDFSPQSSSSSEILYTVLVSLLRNYKQI